MITSSSSLHRIEEQQIHNSKDSIYFLLVNMDKAMTPINLEDQKETDYLNQSTPFSFIKKEQEYNSNVYIVSAETENTQHNETLSGGIINNGNIDLIFN